ncbi:MAG: hypothetical protein WC553_01735 [Patescibacteria group bacterium]|jgi:hypothetical protein
MAIVDISNPDGDPMIALQILFQHTIADTITHPGFSWEKQLGLVIEHFRKQSETITQLTTQIQELRRDLGAMGQHCQNHKPEVYGPLSPLDDSGI